MREKLTTALTLLKKASGSRGYLYEQPWYAIIGPPGAGKTTALLNAGLIFPLAAEMGQSAVAGVGGTRMCDWWFTENAVLIDTAGRYTTQDSDAAVDKAGWHAFLGLLKRTRARQPLNGVLVAIALSDIAAAPQRRTPGACARDPASREGAVRPAWRAGAGLCAVHQGRPDRRLHRVLRRPGPRAARPGLGHHLPAEQVGSRHRRRRSPTSFSLLVERLNQRLLDRLQAERSPDRRTLIAGFPAQVASLAAPLAEFLTEAFGGSRLDPAPLLRGVYLTSGTQEGTPIDRLTGAMARSFGIDAQRAPSLRPEQGRSYFLTRLLKEVIFGEATLVSRDPGAGAPQPAGPCRRAAASRRWSRSLGAAALIQTRSASTRQCRRRSRTPRSPPTPRRRSRCRSIRWPMPTCRASLPLLDMARALPFGVDAPTAADAVVPGPVADRQTRRRRDARSIATTLDHVLLPRLIVRLEDQMRANFEQPGFPLSRRRAST